MFHVYRNEISYELHLSTHYQSYELHTISTDLSIVMTAAEPKPDLNEPNES